MDHFNKSTDKTFSLPLIRLLGHNASSNGNNSILLNPGGPGGSGVGFLARGGEKIIKIVGENFNLLSFDPRGVAGSVPQALCYTNDEGRSAEFANNPWSIDFEAGEMYTKAENKARACQDITGEHGWYINTPQTAADMNTILDAIGQEKMFYWGFSYGTTLGQTYAQMFPERVSRFIIDGVSNLDDWYNAFFEEESLSDTDNVYAGFVEECFKAKDNCPLNFINNTAFETTHDLKTYLDDFLENLEEVPIAVYVNASDYGAITRRSVVTNGIFSSLYRPSPTWPFLASNLAAMLNGNPKPVYSAYSDNWIAGILTDDSNTFVHENDNRRSGGLAPVHGPEAIRKYAQGLVEDSKLVRKYQGSDMFDRASWSVPTTHDFHPHYYPKHPKFKTAEPILILSTTYDPVCPLVSALKAHNSFEGSAFLIQQSYGHCSISMPSLCTARHVRRYFNEGVLPEEGSKCGIDAEYFPASNEASALASGDLNAEDAELLAALEDLAAADILGPTVAGRFRGL